MRAKLLSLLILAAAATAGTASAQQASIDGPEPQPTPTARSVPDGYHAALARQLDEERSDTPRPVFAVVGQNVVSGELRPDERLMALVDTRQPTFSCAPSQRGAEVVLNCSNGASAQMKLDASGCGRSLSGEAASLCIGLPPEKAARRLTAPAGKTLRIDGERLVLEPVAGD